MNKILVAVMMALGLTACSNQDDLEAWMEGAARDLKVSIDPIPQMTPYEPAPYDVASLLDPFNSAKIVPAGRRGNRGSGPLEPDYEARELRNNIMERYALESMNMIGVLNLNNQTMAAILVDNLVRQVKLGDYIGVDFGVVTQITDNEVTIKEVVENQNGEWVERINTLKLQVKEGA
ncbi:MAG: pilus assembly protein PilP [Zoogloeaceae bacterium]|jgi:type IV pilus assembly protein PilP|nr:pilus assembly protein PilP [Zoogloeaceae bacterium]